MNVVAFALDQSRNPPNHMWGVSFIGGQLLMGAITATAEEGIYVLATRDGTVYFSTAQVAYIKA